MPLVYVLCMAVGFGLAVGASRRAVAHTTVLVSASRIPPFVAGITLLAIGTDLPEIANSIVSSVGGHGDLNIGDSIGSSATQATLVLGLLPFIVGPFVIGKARVWRIGWATTAALLVTAALAADGRLSRLDALLLFLVAGIGFAFVADELPPQPEPAMQLESRGRAFRAVAVLAWLGVVAAGASLAVWSLVRLAEGLGVAEYLLAFFVGSIGTSLPELIVDITALRAGARDLAVGDVFGSSFIDATLSVGAGPLIAPTAITASLAVRGSLAAATALAVVVLLLSRGESHNRWTGAALLGLYAAFYAVLLI